MCGELDADELRLTSLDPENRVSIKVSTDKKETEDKLVKVLFGSNPDLRKDFIKEHLLV